MRCGVGRQCAVCVRHPNFCASLIVVPCFLESGVAHDGCMQRIKFVHARTWQGETAVTAALLHDVVDDTRQCMCILSLKP